MRQILFGWVYENDNGYGLLAIGWQGTFALPRDMFVKRWTVQDSRADDRGSWGVVARSGSTATLETLGTRPAEEVKALIDESKTKWSEKSWAYSRGNRTWTGFKKQPKSRFYALSATISFNSSASDVMAGFTIFKSLMGLKRPAFTMTLPPKPFAWIAVSRAWLLDLIWVRRRGR